jgi:rfaE bifunctional protein nucleotidyltransferase chain/domain/rfaE bifunctional protein kinase chain/domain
MNRLIIVGDSLLDRDVEGSVERLCPDAPVPVVDEPQTRVRPGGAALAAAIAARSGRAVALVTAIAADEAGRELRELIRHAGVDLIALQTSGPTTEKVRIRAGGRTLVRLDHGGRAAAEISVSRAQLRALRGATVLVADYGRGMTRDGAIRNALADARCLVWDPHPRGAAPVPGARLVTPNRVEAGLATDASIAQISARARELARAWRVDGVAVTLGAGGALLCSRLGVPISIPAPRVAFGDPCGAGDCFAATAAACLADGDTVTAAVSAGVAAASAFVSAGGAANACLEPLRETVELEGIAAAHALIAETRARGERVVATGGCFDLLHAGHIASLRAARDLGGCLVVCLNSDASVRRLKGASRPLVAEKDRVEVLRALSFVDAVVVFDEDTPETLLRQLKPDVFVKGGDYELAEMPEARLLRSWGGEAVLVPFVEGYSTTSLLQEFQRRAG